MEEEAYNGEFRFLVLHLALFIRAAQGRSGLPCIVHLLYPGLSEHPAASFSYTNPPFWEVLLLLPHCPPQAAFVSLQHTEVVPAQISFQSCWQNTRCSVLTHLFTAKNKAQEPWLVIQALISPTCLLSQLTACGQIQSWEQTCTWTCLPTTTKLAFPP